MSNFLAIATVTEALHQLLQAEVEDDVNNVDVTTLRPEAAAGNQDPRVNIYLYRVSPNAALRNRELPNRTGDGLLRQRPVAALDLHYLFSFFGSEAELVPQRLLGSTVRVLHDFPVITREMLDDVRVSPTFPVFLAASDLDQQPELVKFTPAQLSLDDLSKVWSVFFQTPYALSVAYEATVVLIEGDETPRAPLPVRQRNLRVLPFRQPRLESIGVEDAPSAPVVAGSTILIKGRQLQGDVTRLRFGDVLVTPDVVSDAEILLTLAEPPFPMDALRAGVQGVQVVQELLFGTPADPHEGFSSNVAPFVLHPTVSSSSVNAAGTLVTIDVDPPLREGQRATLLLNALAGDPPAAYSFTLPPATSNVPQLAFPVSGVAAGQYLVRVQVDGAESPLDLDPASPGFGPTEIFP
jgi:hypothetical protein